MAVTSSRRMLDYALAGLLLVLPAAMMHASLKNPARLSGFDRTVLKVSAPLQAAASWVIEGIGGVWDRYVWNIDSDRRLDEVTAAHLELTRENERLRRENRQLSAFRELAGVREEMPAETVGARVVSVGQSPYFRVTRITIDRGADQVRAGMPVLAPEGVVGRISAVYGGYADVQLAVDSESSIPVMISATGARGVLRGVGSDNKYLCRIEYMSRTEEVRVGDLVVTSGLGGVFPGDVPVGTVRRVEKQEYGLYQEVEVAPAVEFGRLSAVLVLLAAPPPPDPDADKKKTPEKPTGVVPR